MTARPSRLRTAIRTIFFLGCMAALALIVLYLVYPAAIHESVAWLALDVREISAPDTSPDAAKRGHDKIAQIHTFVREVDRERQAAILEREGPTVSISDKEMNSYILSRLEQQRAGKLPRTIRHAIDNAQIKFTDGGFVISGNVAMAQLAAYVETEYRRDIPDAYKKRRTTFRVAGTIEASGGRGKVVITASSLGRIPAAAVRWIPKAETLARKVVGSTLVKDTLEATLIPGEDLDTLTFKMPPGIESVRARKGALDITRSLPPKP